MQTFTQYIKIVTRYYSKFVALSFWRFFLHVVHCVFPKDISLNGCSWYWIYQNNPISERNLIFIVRVNVRRPRWWEIQKRWVRREDFGRRLPKSFTIWFFSHFFLRYRYCSSHNSKMFKTFLPYVRLPRNFHVVNILTQIFRYSVIIMNLALCIIKRY